MTKETTPLIDIGSFEEKLEALETLVGELDSEEVSLQKSLENFERGVALYKECQEFMNLAEKKIQVLTDSLKLKDHEQGE